MQHTRRVRSFHEAKDARHAPGPPVWTGSRLLARFFGTVSPCIFSIRLGDEGSPADRIFKVRLRGIGATTGLPPAVHQRE